MRRIWIGLIGLLIISLCGCEPQGWMVGGKPHKGIKRIVSLSPSTTEVLGALLIQDKLAGRTASCDYPPEVGKAPVVVSGTKPDYERIIGLRPDVIVYDASLYSKSDIEKFSVLTDTKIFALDTNTVEGLQKYMLDLGGFCGAASMASKKADEIYAAMENARATDSVNKTRVTIFMGGSGDFCAGTESFLADVVRVSGGQLFGPSGKVFTSYNVESMIKANPEVILTAGKAADILRDPRFASLAAVKAKPTPRVYEVTPSVLLRTSPRVKGLITNLTSILGQTRKTVESPQ